MLRKSAAGIALAALLWPATAGAACSVKALVGTWSFQLAATEYVRPDLTAHGGIWEENSHISCEVRIRKASGGKARGIVGECASWGLGMLTPPGPERKRFLLVPRGACTWTMVSEVVQNDLEVLRTGILGTRGGLNNVQTSPDGDTLVGSGNYLIGMGDTGDGFGSEWPAVRTYDDGSGNGQEFAVTLFGVKLR